MQKKTYVELSDILAPGRKQKTVIADEVIRCKDVQGLSWGQLTIKINKEGERSGEKVRTLQGYRSLYRSRKRALALLGIRP